MPNLEQVNPGIPVPPPSPRGASAFVNGHRSPLPWLNQLGRLSAGFDGKPLLPLLSHPNEKVRRMAAFNLGKLGDANFLPPLRSLAFDDPNTLVRREAASAIGRMRDKRTIPALVRITKDADPNEIIRDEIERERGIQK